VKNNIVRNQLWSEGQETIVYFRLKTFTENIVRIGQRDKTIGIHSGDTRPESQHYESHSDMFNNSSKTLPVDTEKEDITASFLILPFSE
jgi:hypothetical protein